VLEPVVRGDTGDGIVAGSSAERAGVILVVDDTEFVLKVLVAILEAAKFVVLQADSGFKAMELAANYPGMIDLLLSDVRMPGMPGPYLAKLLQESRPNLRILLTGGDALQDDCGWAFIQKPFMSVKLIEVINSLLHTDQGCCSFVARKAARIEPSDGKTKN
jgi:DNA-binding NtrC family response regulator